jgi:MFS family permease
MSVEASRDVSGARAGRLFFGWWVVFTGFVSLAFGASALLFFPFGVFIRPLSAEFGWSIPQIAFALTLVSYTIVVASPLQGLLLDKFGVRRVVLPSSVAFAAGFALMSLLPANLAVYYAGVVVLAVLGIGIYPGAYAKAAAGWFDRRLGVAVGIVSAGGGVGAAILPTLTQHVISAAGWRTAYLTLGGLSFLAVFVPGFFLLRNQASDLGLGKDGDMSAAASPATGAIADHQGYTLREALTHKDFICICCTFFLLGLVTTGMLANQVPMLISMGYSAQTAALVQSTFGVALIVGRFLAGYLLDRFFAPYVMIGFLLGPIAALIIYASAPAGDIVFLCSFLIGLAVGAEFDVIAYFTGRYFGRKAYGKIYGAFYSFFMLGSGLGSVAFALARDNWGGYGPGLWTLAAIAVASCVALALVGPYPNLATKRD